MVFDGDVFTVFVDGMFVGIVEDEDYIWDIAQDHVNGTPYPLTDDNMPDRVFYHKINVNRWVISDETVRVVVDKYNPQNTIGNPYGLMKSKEIAETLNRADLDREKYEAKLRAMTL